MITLAVIIGAWLCWWTWLTIGLLMPSLYLLDTGLLWLAYLAVMRLQEVRDAGKLPPDIVPIATAALYFGLAVDLVYNWTWAIAVYCDVPRELLVTQRLERYKYGRAYRLQRTGRCRWSFVRVDIAPATGWRLARTDWNATNMLDPFDPSGQHLRP